MRFFDKLLLMLAKSPRFATLFTGTGAVPPERKTEDFLKAYTYWAFACASAIAESVAEVPYHLYWSNRDNKKEEIFDHPVLELLSKVNPWMTEYELREMIQIHLELVGEAWWGFEQNGLALPAEIWPLFPQYVHIEPSQENFISHIEYRVPGTRVVKYGPNEFIQFKNTHPTSLYRGWGTARAAAYPLDIHQYAMEWARKFFFNDATPGGLLTTDQAVDGPTIDMLRNKWRQGHQGVNNAHRVAVLGYGLKWQSIQNTFKDLQMTEEMRQLRDDVLAIFKVPKHILGIADDVNRANAEAAEYGFAKRVVRPRLRRIEQRINEFLIPLFDENLWIEFENPVPEDKELRLRQADRGWRSGFMKRNEARELIGLDPDEEKGDLYINEIELSGPPAQGRLYAGWAQKKTAGRTDPDKGEGLTPQQREERWKEWVKQLEPRERKLKSAVKKYFQWQQDEVNRRLRDMAPGQIDSLRPEAGRKEINIEALFWDEAEAEEKMDELVVPAVIFAITQAGNETLVELGLEVSFDQDHPAVGTRLREQLRRIKDIDDTTREALRKTLLEGLEQGESIPQLADRISEVFAEAKGPRAERIARTEAASASNLGALEAYRQSAVVEKKEWVAELDERVRIAHAAADGQIVPVDEPFTVDGESLMYPGDPNGSAGNVINCRCTMAPVTKTDDDGDTTDEED